MTGGREILHKMKEKACFMASMPDSPDTRGKGGASKRITHGSHLVKGKSNHAMEDCLVCEFKQVHNNDLGLFAIYDGHMGHDVANYLQTHLFNNILKEHDVWTDTVNATRRAYHSTDRDILAKAFELGKGGSTAVTAMLINSQTLIVANVGDSRAVISKKGVAEQLSVDHEPNRERGVTLPFSVREGINIFLAGFVPTENLRFRDESLTFKVAEIPQEVAEEIESYARYRYPTMTKTQGNFKLKVAEGEFTDSQIIVMLGENGTGKTTFIRMLAGLLKPDVVEGSNLEIPEFNVSYKPQKISPKFQSTVRHLLHQKIRDSYMHPQFCSDVMKPLQIEQLMDQEVVNLSGGELQRVALTLCLGKPADIYLIDEPSAYLDSEQRIVASKVIKRFILHTKKTAFVVEHDFIMAAYLADRVIVYEGTPSMDCVANAPQSLLTGMNLFLSHLNITFRRDPTNFRPRINKLESAKDREQKLAGSYYYLDD